MGDKFERFLGLVGCLSVYMDVKKMAFKLGGVMLWSVGGLVLFRDV
jgi:hypothetical protein